MHKYSKHKFNIFNASFFNHQISSNWQMKFRYIVPRPLSRPCQNLRPERMITWEAEAPLRNVTSRTSGQWTLMWKVMSVYLIIIIVHCYNNNCFLLAIYFVKLFSFIPGSRQQGAASCDLLPESEPRQWRWRCEAEVTSISMRANYAHGQTHADPAWAKINIEELYDIAFW